MDVRDGYTFVWGKERSVARALIDAADRLGVERLEVRTVNGGFIVPDAVADEARDELDAGPRPDPPDPDQQF